MTVIPVRARVARWRSSRWWSPWLAAAPAGLALAVLLAVIERSRLATTPFTTTDLHVYWLSGRAVRTGHDPYRYWLSTVHISLVYPPFAGLLFVPLSLLSLATLRIVWFTGIFAALELIVWWATGWVGLRAGWARLLLSFVAAAALPYFDPVREELWAGQINVFLTLLIMADLIRPDGARGRGAWIGVATGIKLVPGLFLVYFLLTRRIREAAVGAAVFALTVLAGFVTIPGPAWRYWTDYAWDANRVFPLPYISLNQSLRGSVARLLHRNDVTAWWAPVAVLVVAAGLAVCVALHRRGLDREGAMLCGVVALLVSPITWAYHWVWLVPVLVVLAAGTWRARAVPWAAALWGLVAAVTFLAAVVHPYTWMPKYPVLPPHGPVKQLETSALVLVGLLLIAAGAALSWSRRDRPAPRS
jgi:alpha-1,2-mannosyltransferase